MKKLALLLSLPIFLASCNGSILGFGPGKIDIGVSTSDAASTGTYTKTIISEKRDDKGVITTPASISIDPKNNGDVTFVFTARPGSDAAYITGYRITRYEINGADVLHGSVMEEHKSNVYVTSGYACAERTASFSCTPDSKNIVPANGLPSAEFSLNFVGALLDVAGATEANASSSVDLEFIGHTSNNVEFTLPVKGINSSVSYAELHQ